MALFVRISTEVLTHRKFLAAGSNASWLWLKGLLYAKEHLTDGFIPDEAIAVIAAGIQTPKAAIGRLCSCDLWQPVDGGYTVGAERWAEWQTTKSQVESQRDASRDRKRKSRSGHSVTDDGVTTESQRQVVGHVTPNPNHQSTEHIAHSSDITPEMVASGVITELRIGGDRLRMVLEQVVRSEMKAGADPTELRDRMIASGKRYEGAKPQLKFSWGMEKFYGDGNWRNEAGWPWDTERFRREAGARIGTDDPSKRRPTRGIHESCSEELLAEIKKRHLAGEVLDEFDQAVIESMREAGIL